MRTSCVRPAALAMVLVLAACDATGPDLREVREIQLIVPDTLGVRESVQLDLVVTNRAGDVVPDADITLVSTDPAIASLDTRGRLTGHAEGSLQVIAMAGTEADTAEIHVALALLFAKDVVDTGYLDLFVMTRHRTAIRNLTNYEYTDMDGVWSPDRTRIAFLSTRTGSGVILLMNADGSDVQELETGLAGAREPAWSPDGTKIAFAGSEAGQAEKIYVIDVDGSDLTALTGPTGAEGWPAWSPDGTRIAFGRSVDGSMDIHVMNADGSAVQRLTTSLTSEFAPVWSPDGQRIAFTGNITVGPGYGIHVMDQDGSNLTRVGDQHVRQFDWSPDGDWFGYAAKVDGQWDLFTLPSIGGDPIRLTNDAEVEQNVRWR